MYTMAPLPNTFDAHAGFWIVLTVATVLLAMALWSQKNDRNDIGFSGPFWYLCLVACAGWVSWNTGDIPTNAKVEGQLVTGHSETSKEERVGKITQIVNRAFVTYTVPGGEVTFERKTGVLYPNSVVLYKN